MSRAFVNERDRTIKFTHLLEHMVSMRHEQVECAYAEAFAESSEKHWIEREGVTATEAHPCLYRLAGRACPKTRDTEDECLPAGFDHTTMWNKNGKPHIILTQPYHISPDSMMNWQRLCNQLGLSFWISTSPSFHYPGRVLSVEFKRD
jgi:hypothetical protein